MGELEVVYKGMRNGLPRELDLWHVRGCTCDNPALELRISSISGEKWTVGADHKWTVLDAKRKLEKITSILLHEQRLVTSVTVLPDQDQLQNYVSSDVGFLELTLVRRQPQQAMWLKRVGDTAASLREAPPEIRNDSEIVLLALGQDPAMLTVAAPSLLEEPNFVFAAVQCRGGPGRDEFAMSDLSWVNTVGDVILVLCASAHLGLPGLATLAMAKPQFQNQKSHSSEDLAFLVASLAMAERMFASSGVDANQILDGVAALLDGLSQEAVRKTLRRPALASLPVGTKLLGIQANASQTGVLGQFVGSILGWGGKSDAPALDEVLPPQDFALALFARHADALQQSEDSEMFGKLLPHLRAAAHGIRHGQVLLEIGALVRTCVHHGQSEDGRNFFIFGTDASNETAALLLEVGFPLTVLQEHRHRAALLRTILQEWGGPDVVADAVAQDRCSLRRLLRVSEGDALIGRCPELQDALRVTAEREAEQPGRALLRAFSAATPCKLPEFEVPLSWLQELRGIRGCDSLAIDSLLQALHSKADTELREEVQQAWQYVSWQSASASQVSRAVDIVQRCGKQGLLQVSELSGRESERHRLELHEQLVHALDALPLMQLEDEKKLLAPELPAQAASLFALQRAKLAEDRARQAEEQVRRLQTNLDNVRDEANRRASSLESRVSSLASDVRSLEGKVSRIDRPDR